MGHTTVPFPSNHFNLHKLADGVFAAIAVSGGAAISNAGIIDLGDRTLIFDTFMTPQAAHDLRLAAQQLTGRDPELIINSHYHNDHIWGNQVFSPQSLILSTAQTLKLIQTESQEELKDARETSAGRLDQFSKQYEAAQDEKNRRDLLLWVGYYRALVDNLPNLTVRLPDITFEGRLTIYGSSRSVELISFGDSHTSSDTILLLRDAGIIFMADLLFVNSHLFLAECDVFKLLDSVKQISVLDASVFVPGHGPMGSAADLRSNVDYISTCINTARILVAEGDTSRERLAREAVPAQFENWELARFFTINLQSLCSKLSSKSTPF
jgi:glyoxylase-like metal-dependent hydrolase (beta-lactamase superfamily II)